MQERGKAVPWPHRLRQTPPIWAPVLAAFSAKLGAYDIFKRLAGRQVIDIPGDQVAPSPDRSPGPNRTYAASGIEEGAAIKR